MRVCGPPAFTGRERELAALAQALAGPPAVVLVEGEAGIGKTRLLREYLTSAPGRQRTVLVATCPPLARPQTLGPVAEAIREAASGGVGGLGLSGLAGALRPLFPEWSASLPPAPEQAEDASAARYRVFAALRELLERLDAGLLAVEDAHWADEASLEFVLYLASVAPRRVSLVVTCRPEEVPARSLLPKIARLACGLGGLRLVLGPLDVGQTGVLASSMLAGAEVSGEFAAFLYGHTGGVPLAVEESVRLLVGRDDLARSGGRWVRRPLEQLQVPATIRDAVLERAARLAADGQAVLAAAAVLAEPAGEDTVAAVAGITAERARAGLSEALARGLLAEDDRGLVVFRHVLACRAVYEAIPGPDRRVLHSRAGQAIEAGMPLPVARLAHHFREAGDSGRWCRYAEQAADLAMSSGDEACAAALLCDLIVHAGLRPAEVARLTGKVVLTLLDNAQIRDLVSVLRRALDAGSLAPGEEASVRFQLGRVLLLLEESDAARAQLEGAVSRLPRDSAESARAMLLLGMPTGAPWPAATHLRWLQRAALASSALDEAERLRLAVDRATALLMLGEESGWEAAAMIPWEASAPRDRLQIIRGHLNVCQMAILWGRYGEASHRLARAAELAEAHGYQRFHVRVLVVQSYLSWLTGAWAGLAERAAGLAGDESLPSMDMLPRLVTGLLHASAGARIPAAEDLRLVLDEARRRGAVDCEADPTAALARLALADGRPGDAVKLTDGPIGIVAGKGTWIWAAELAPARAEALTAIGQADQAAELVTAFARGLRGRDAPAPKAALIACRAILAQARSEHAHAAALSARAAAAWQALPRPYEALLARERQARCLLAAGRPQAGLALLAEVRRELAALGARGDADRVERTLREHGVTVPRGSKGGRPGYGDQLSPRELEVVRLVAAGLTNREIARELCRSPNTVGTQLTSAMRKLSVSSRAALAAKVVAAGPPAGRAPHGPAGQSLPGPGAA